MQFRKSMGNVRNNRDIKRITVEAKRNYLVSEPNYDTIKNISYNLLAIEIKKVHKFMNKLVYLGLSVLEKKVKKYCMDLGMITKNKITIFQDFRETKIGRKNKFILQGYRRLYTLHKNRKLLRRHYKKCFHKIRCFKQTIT